MASVPAMSWASPRIATRLPTAAIATAEILHDICAAATTSPVSPTSRATSSAVSGAVTVSPPGDETSVADNASVTARSRSGASRERMPGTGSHWRKVAAASAANTPATLGIRSGSEERWRCRSISANTSPTNVGTTHEGTPPIASAGNPMASAVRPRVHGRRVRRAPWACRSPEKAPSLPCPAAPASGAMGRP
jgi:hypothetical protein